MSKHTPGPWIFDAVTSEVFRNDGDVYPLIAFVEHENTSGDQSYADGHLIAAAPELLRIAEQVLKDIEFMVDYFEGPLRPNDCYSYGMPTSNPEHPWHDTVKLLLAVIAMAKGEKP